MQGLHRRSRSGFTLVELLVVIGIIALLISILLPVLNRVREQANSVKCMAQMKQIMTAMLMYTGDNKGSFAIMPLIGETYNTNNTGVAGSLMYYMDENPKTGGPRGAIRYDCGALWPYLSPGANKRTPDVANPSVPNESLKKVMNCPSETDESRVVFLGGTSVMKRNFSYAWIIFLRQDPANSGYTRYVARKLSQVRNSAQKIILIEEVAPNDGSCFIGPDQNDEDDEPAFRHNGKGNYGFADGHVQSLLPSDMGYDLVKSAKTGVRAHPVNLKRRDLFFNLTDATGAHQP